MTTTTLQIGGAVVVMGDAPFVEGNSVPARVTAFQAKAALHEAGLLESVEAMMANSATPKLVKLAWAEALHFERYSPTVLALGAALGLSQAQIDDLFQSAAQITA